MDAHSTPDAGYQRRTVLVVDDMVSTRFICRTLLTSAGFLVIEAVNGAEAVDIINGAAIDLILLDIHMPVLDGWAVLRTVGLPHTRADLPPIILHTSEPDGDVPARAAGFGVEVIRKPCTDLVARVERAIAQHALAPK